jgi:hypothetical protein
MMKARKWLWAILRHKNAKMTPLVRPATSRWTFEWKRPKIAASTSTKAAPERRGGNDTVRETFYLRFVINFTLWRKQMRKLDVTKRLLFAVATFASVVAFMPEASAVVCARGPYRAGCAGPRGAVVAPRGGYYARPYYAPRPYGARVYRRW